MDLDNNCIFRPQAFIRYRSNLYFLYFANSGVMYNTGTKNW